MASPGAAGSIRLDKLLWFLRFARSRSLAQAVVAAGHIRPDRRARCMSGKRWYCPSASGSRWCGC